MKHTYIAVYSMMTPPEEQMKFHSTEEFTAESDDVAMTKAENISLALEMIENNRLGTGGKLPTTKAIVLISITDQETRKKIYSVGYTIEE